MHAQPSGFGRRRIRILVTSTAVPKVLTIVPEQTGELFSPIWVKEEWPTIHPEGHIQQPAARLPIEKAKIATKPRIGRNSNTQQPVHVFIRLSP